MGIIAWLILSLGAFGAVHGSKCIPETAVCSPYWVKMEPHKNLMESVEELNSWCRKQSMFFRCLDDVLLSIYGNYSRFPINMLVSKMFSEDLCLEESTNRKRYLDNAACINQLDFEYCTLPEYLEIVTPDGSVPPTKCSLQEKTFSCIAAAIVMRCGFDAGRVYRYLLKVSKYGEEVCGEESSGATCEEVPDSELSQIYYGLVHRFGRIPEQVTEAGSLDEKSMFLSEKSISEAMKNALDDVETSSEGEVSYAGSTSDYNEVIRNKDEFRKKPIITEPFKGLLFYNYSNEQFEFYWRQPGSFPISRVTCDHIINSDMKGVMFECILYYGYEEPECVKLTEEDEKVTPELIRDIDLTIPEDGELHISKSPDWTAYLRDYKRHRMSWEFFFNAKIVSEDKDIRWVNEQLEVEYPNSEVCAKELRFYDVINDKYIDWWQCPSFFSDELRKEILNLFFQNRSSDQDFFFLTAVNGNDTNGKWITYIHFFEPLFHGFEKVVCERVNECHPRGRGVFKCSLERRGIEGCDSCCVQFPYYAKFCPTKRGTQSKDEREFSEFNSSEDGSGALEDESLTESATFIVNDDETASPDESTSFVTGVSDGDIIAVDISELPDDSAEDFSSEASLTFLRRNSDDSNTDSFVTQPEDTDSISEEEALYDNPSELELRLHKNLFVLQAVPSIADIEAVYEIIESKDHSK